MGLPVESYDSLPNKISPEGAVVANIYLETGCNLREAAQRLDMLPHDVSAMLDTKEIKVYIQNVLAEAGIRQMDEISDALDEVIQTKLSEMKDLEITSNKDIVDMLTARHKMIESKMKIIGENRKTVGPGTQNNQQINVFGESQYGKLMERLMNGEG
jgi:hypothetical protein